MSGLGVEIKMMNIENLKNKSLTQLSLIQKELFMKGDLDTYNIIIKIMEDKMIKMNESRNGMNRGSIPRICLI
jgi:hypothetical protein